MNKKRSLSKISKPTRTIVEGAAKIPQSPQRHQVKMDQILINNKNLLRNLTNKVGLIYMGKGAVGSGAEPDSKIRYTVNIDLKMKEAELIAEHTVVGITHGIGEVSDRDITQWIEDVIRAELFNLTYQIEEE